MSDYVIKSGRLEYRYQTGVGWSVRVAGWASQLMAPVHPVTGLTSIVGTALDRELAGQVAGALRVYAEQGTVRPPTRVVSVRGWDRRERVPGEELYDPVEYVGRRVAERSAMGPGKVLWREHPLHNPFRVRNDASEPKRREAVRDFTEYVRSRAASEPAVVREIEDLRGKRLGCWCGTWDGSGHPGFHCHAVVLARMADGLPV